MLKKLLLIQLFFLIPCVAFSSEAVDFKTNEKSFIDLKKRGLYLHALPYIEKMIFSATNDTELSLSLLRLYDFSDIPEARNDLRLILSRVEAAKICSGYTEKLLYCIFVKIADEAYDHTGLKRAMEKGGFVNRMDNYPPLKISSDEDFDTADISSSLVAHYSELPAYDGTFSPGAGLEDSGKLYLLEKHFSIAEERTIVIYAGKSGRFELLLDGKSILNEKNRTEFFPVQYAIKVTLSAGNHRLTVKSATSDQMKNRFSIAIDGLISDTVAANAGSILFYEKTELTKSSVSDDSYSNYYHGMISYFTGIRQGDNSATKYLSVVPIDNVTYSDACYYAALASTENEEKDLYLRKALLGDKRNLEAAVILSQLKLNNGMIYQAAEILSEVSKEDNSPLLMLSRGQYFCEMKWQAEALKEAENLLHAGYPSLGRFLQSRVFFINGQMNLAYNSAVTNFLERKSRIAADYIEKSANGRRDEAYLLLSSADPGNAAYRLNYARALLSEKKTSEAFSAVMSVLSRYPYLAQGYYAAGDIYTEKGKTQLAEWYYSKAAELDRGNKLYSDRAQINRKETDPFLKYRISYNLDALRNEGEIFSTEPSVTLYDDAFDKVYFDGTVKEIRRKAILINKVAAAQSEARQGLYIDPSTDSIDSVVSRIVEKNGTVREVNSLSRRNMSDVASRLYYNYESATVSFNDLNDGDIIIFEYSVTRRQGRNEGGFLGSRKIFDRGNRILHARYLLSADKRIPLFSKVYNLGVAITKKNAGNDIEYLFTAQKIEPLKEEFAQPHYSKIDPMVVFSRFKNWSDFHSWYKNLLRNRSQLSDEMKKKVNELVKDKKTDREKVAAIYSFATSRTRYVGFELGIGSFQPRSCEAVYSSGLGDCKDTANLISSMLRYAGIPAYLALLKTYNAGVSDFSFPYAGNFNHAIAYVDIDGDFFLDGTVQNYGINELPEADRNVTALVIKNDAAETILIKGSDYSADKEVIHNNVTIEEKGSTRIIRTLKKEGDYASSIRDSFDRREKKNDEISRYWNSLFPGAVVTPLTLISNTPGDPVEYSYSVSLNGFADVRKDTVIFPITLQKEQYLRDLVSSAERESDLEISSSYSSTSETKVTLPPGFFVISDEFSFADQFGENRFSYSMKKTGYNSVLISYTVSLRRGTIKKADYDAFRRCIIHFIKAESAQILAVKK